MFRKHRHSHTVLTAALLAMLGFGLLLPGFAQNRYSLVTFYKITREARLVQALALLNGTSASDTVDLIVERPIRIIFKRLKDMDERLENYDAISYLGFNGQLMIYINDKHLKAPPEALAAIIAHEAIHHDAHNSLREEVAGWSREALIWHELKSTNPELAALPEGEYDLVDRLNTIEKHYRQGDLETFVRGQQGYQGLPEHSPGF